jgi:hypothetical protein
MSEVLYRISLDIYNMAVAAGACMKLTNLQEKNFRCRHKNRVEGIFEFSLGNLEI